MIGPLAWWELVRAARQRRSFAARAAFLAALAVTLGFIFNDVNDNTELTALAGRILLHSLGIAFLAVFTLTPAVVAPAVAGEVSGGRLEFLLTTPLSAAGIVLGKGVARVASVGLVLLAGLPVVSLLQLLGGVDPASLAAGVAAVALALLSVTALSLLASVVCRSPRDSGTLVYALLFGWFIASLWAAPWWQTWPAVSSSPSEVVAEVFAGGNPVVFLDRLSRRDTYPLAVSLAQFAIGHLGLTAVCLVLAVAWFRPMARRHLYPAPRAGARAATRVRPPVWDRATLWLEVCVGGRYRGLSWALWGGSALVGLAALIGMRAQPPEAQIIVAVMLGTFALLRCVMRASLSVAGEQERQMIELLRTTPAEPADVLLAKWVGALLAPWRGMLVVTGVLLLSVAAGTHPASVPAFLAAWLVYALGLSAVGLLASVMAPRPAVALGMSLAAAIFLMGGHLLLLALCCVGGGPDSPAALPIGLTPVVGLSWMAAMPRHPTPGAILPSIMSGYVLWPAFAVAVFGTALGAFTSRWQPEGTGEPTRKEPS